MAETQTTEVTTPAGATPAAGPGQSGEGATPTAPVAQGQPDSETVVPDPSGTPAPEGVDPAATPGTDEPTGAPETYETFTLPEGVVLEPEGQEQLVGFGKKHNLSQAAAQEALDLATAHVQRLQERALAAHGERIEQWATQAKADPVVGGKDYETNVQVALEAVGVYGDPELKQAFEEYGLGNHPAFIRAFYRIGKAMKEGGAVHGLGQAAPGAPAKFEDRFMAAASQPLAGQKRP